MLLRRRRCRSSRPTRTRATYRKTYRDRRARKSPGSVRHQQSLDLPDFYDYQSPWKSMRRTLSRAGSRSHDNNANNNKRQPLSSSSSTAAAGKQRPVAAAAGDDGAGDDVMVCCDETPLTSASPPRPPPAANAAPADAVTNHGANAKAVGTITGRSFLPPPPVVGIAVRRSPPRPLPRPPGLCVYLACLTCCCTCCVAYTIVCHSRMCLTRC